jgi:hypothetical protein
VLQDCLRGSREALAAQGVLYPENPPGCAFNNHRMLLFGFVPVDGMPRHVRKHPQYSAGTLAAHYAGFLEHLGRQMDAIRPEAVVLSSETLFRDLRPEGRRSLRAALAPLGEPTVAVYLRRPSDYYLSALQQRLKSAHSVTAPRVKSPVRVLRAYAATFGAAALRPRVYDRARLTDGDIVADFLGAHLPEFGVDPAGLRRRAWTNETISAEAMDLMRRFRLAFHPREENAPSEAGAQLVRLLHKSDTAVGAARPRLRPEIAERIDYARPDPLELRDAHGLVFPGLDYRRLERMGRRRNPLGPLTPLLRALWRPWRLEEIVAIDPEVRTALLERIGRSRWARADPAHARWIGDLLRAPGTA